MKQQEILKFARKSIFDTVKRLGEWNGYEVWEPGFSDGEPRYIGFPQFILVKGNSIRWAKDDRESTAIMKKIYINKTNK